LARREFHQELDRLVSEVLGLGREVEACLGTMVEAVEDWDVDVAGRVVGSDVRFKGRGAEIVEKCMVLQARQAPVARDLRLIHTAQTVTNHHLVRTGTLCEHICGAIVETANAERDPNLQTTIIEMSLGARDLFREGLDVFEKRDIDHAPRLQAEDDKVDLLYSEAMNLIVNPSTTNTGGGGSPEWRTLAALVVHYLERIADHGVDIGGRTVYLVTGERMEDAMRQYRERRREGSGE
jgi:phosphate transport system protein